MRAKALLALLLFLPFDGCALETLIFGDSDTRPAYTAYPTYTYSANFRSSDNAWIGRSVDDLVDALGPPDMVYEARPRFTDHWKGGTPAYTYVYAAGNGRSGRCIDAYVVAEPTHTVIKYYCR
jgi:hypothetical protein